MQELADDTLVVYAATSEEAASLESRGVWWRRVKYFLILCAVWAIPGLIGGFSIGILVRAPDGEPLVSLSHGVMWQLLAWMPWAIWTAVAIWLVQRVPFRRGSWRQAVLVHLVVCVIVTLIQISLAIVLDRWLGPYEPKPLDQHIRDAFLRLTDFEVVTYMAVVAAGVGFDYFRRYREEQFMAERLRTQMVQAQLLALRSQLNPHFLFNALNSVISLMDRDVPAAQRMVARLGELLRLSLSAAEAEVPLEREISLVMQYLEIEKIRFGERLRVTVDVPSELLDHKVPNLVLQPLVENAILHGVGPRPGPCHVTVQASHAGDTLRLRVIDDGVGLSRTGSGSGHGIGVGNTRARLTAIYGGDASLTLYEGDLGGCIAEVRIPLEAAQRGRARISVA